MSKNNPKPTETEQETTNNNGAQSALKSRIQARIGKGGIAPETVDTLTPFIKAVANTTEQLRLLMEVFDDSKGVKRGRLEKIKSEVASAVEDWTEATGEIITAWDDTIKTAEMVKDITGLTTEEFNHAFRMKKACVVYPDS